MTHTHYTCDKCRARITADRAMVAIKTGSQRDFEDLDLCPGCCSALKSWLAQAPTEAAAATNGVTVH